MNKQIKWLSYWASITGLVFQLIAFLPLQPLKTTIDLINYSSYLSPGINLSFIRNSLFEYRNSDNPFVANYFLLAFYFVMLVGAMLYAKSKGKEKRLLAFSFSIIALFKAFSILVIIISYIKYFAMYSGASHAIFALNLLVAAGWTFIAHHALKLLLANTEVMKSTNDSALSLLIYQKASLNQRFIHHILDLIMSILMFSGALVAIFREELSGLASLAGERSVIYLIIFVSRFIYLIMFEGLWGISPAKLLTSSIVINENGSSIGFKAAFLRTLSRHIPLEAFSFFGDNGWHDTISKTMVVKTNSEGFSATRFLWFIPAFIVMGIGGYVGHELYDDYKSYKYQEGKHEDKISAIQRKLTNLNTAHLIKFEDVESSYFSSPAYYLKVEEVNDDVISASILFIENPYQYKNSELEALYLKNKAFSDSIMLNKSLLAEAMTLKYDDYKKGDRRGIDLFKDGKRYEIEKIYRLFAPAIEDKGTGGMGNGTLSLRMCNYGWPCDLVEIENIEGDMIWENQLPQRLETTDYDSFGSFRLEASNVTRGKNYAFIFTVQDSLGNRYRYQVKGLNMERKCQLIEEILVD